MGRESQSMVDYVLVGSHFYLSKQHLAACIQYQEPQSFLSVLHPPTYLSIVIHQHRQRTRHTTQMHKRLIEASTPGRKGGKGGKGTAYKKHTRTHLNSPLHN